MSLTLTLAELTALERNPSRLVMCCLVGPDRDGEYARLTEHDGSLTIGKAPFDGIYGPTRPVEGSEVSSTSDTATDSLEIVTPLGEDTFTEDDIAAGIFDDLPIVWFATDWGDPTNVAIPIMAGTVGHVKQISDVMAQIEIRGLKDKLQTVIVDTVGPACKARHGVNSGEWPCDVDLEAFTVTGQITSIDLQRRVFTSDDLTVGSPPPGIGNFNYAKLTWLTGANAGRSGEVQADDGNGQLTFLEPFLHDFQVGDEFEVPWGCDRSWDGDNGCGKFGPGRELRFMGEPDMPGLAEMTRGAG